MNWKKEPLGKICKTTSGGTPSRKNQSYYQNGTIPWVKSGELENNIITTSEEFITEEGLLNSSVKIFPAGTLLIALYGATIGKLAFLGIDAATNQAVCGIFQNENVSLKYLYYYLLFQRPNLIKQGVGGAQPNISQTILKKLEISYPDSITEQQRIVARIEELFSELDKAVDTLKTTKEQLTVYRRAVLKDAFSSCEPQVKIKDVCYHVTDGDHMPPPKTTQGIPFIMISNIQNNHINWTATNFVGEEYYKQIGEKRTPRKGDILYTVTGSFGIPVMIDFDKKFCFQRHIALLRPNAAIRQRFLYYALQSPAVYSQATKRATGTAQKTVGLSTLRDISIPYTSDLLMQENIELEVKKGLCACDHIEKNVDTVLAQADAMRQSILKRMFNIL